MGKNKNSASSEVGDRVELTWIERTQ